ncbi:hypothetical protein BATDEDRAFT_35761 [Batrachochytrium dendrobatidis JAM81]|uniref:MPN domain-containing protein n=1 Tax=Batrachochytrium dendrobatidis (strain JAM81 / FGSC 10211) TaxID=684364 RepID=F4P961_BATDJ|nr:proteasome regulatory particle lid subunit RPN8 [Batrachochytrium dendrobatidis JAM81]EGF78123.1 hypothetical protein BATDEDRAFT_35761 [Batrachochytrium dendrobatidis JAM81]KAJ8331231.1 proteasome regulatory particle subunit [Batrachochytrium dendrobatidis]KAK5667614.1 proteasome regulatory particle subunit [Batrachochytrium dendrobatidis]|eukprot:XP_006681150.1 hypothetical protein BATDEDRAFT_35761 [Batrachochytrium dendrobatidis JAM81]
MPATVTSPAGIVVHPLVLLSVVDHYNRTAKNTNKRVLGVLLGQQTGNHINVANSYAMPFEEDEKDPSVWFLDHNYHEAMYDMFKKVNAREKIVGWYHTGPKLRPSDLEINEVFKRYTASPALVIIDVNPSELSIPTDAYMSIEEIHDDGTAAIKTFVHLPSSIEAEESEEIGVEHLLRDIKDTSVSTLSTQITSQVNSLKSLHVHLTEIRNYLSKVLAGKLPINHQIIYNLQEIFNKLPNLSVPTTVKSFAVKTNDELLIIYLSSLIRAVIALHGLIDNKIMLQDHENKENNAATGKLNIKDVTSEKDATAVDIKDTKK